MKARRVPLAIMTLALGLVGPTVARAGDAVVVQPGQPSVTVQQGQPSVTVQPAPSAPSTVVVPAPSTPSTVVVPAPSASVASAPATLQADEIKAHEVRAQTIYANKIESPSIQGTVHQSDTVKVD